MIWWCKSRASLTAAVLVIIATLCMARFGRADMPLPRIVVGVAPFFIFLPALIATALTSLVDRGHPLPEARSTRPVPALMALTLHAAIAAVCGLWLALLLPVWGAPLTWQAVRSVIGYSGLALLAYRYAGPRIGAAAPILYAIVVATMGRDRGAPGWFPLLDASRLDAWALVLALWTVGTLATFTRQARHAHWQRSLHD